MAYENKMSAEELAGFYSECWEIIKQIIEPCEKTDANVAELKKYFEKYYKERAEYQLFHHAAETTHFQVPLNYMAEGLHEIRDCTVRDYGFGGLGKGLGYMFFLIHFLTTRGGDEVVKQSHQGHANYVKWMDTGFKDAADLLKGLNDAKREHKFNLNLKALADYIRVKAGPIQELVSSEQSQTQQEMRAEQANLLGRLASYFD